MAQFWDIIKYGIERSLPPDANNSEKSMEYILAAALSGKVDIWASYSKKDNRIILNGIIVTKLAYDDISDTRNLLIYSIYGYTEIPKSAWKEAVVGIAAYAKRLDCINIVAYSDNPFIIQVSKTLNAEICSHLSFNVDEFVQKLNELGD